MKKNILSFALHFLLMGIITLSPLALPDALAANTYIGINPSSATYTVGTPVAVDLVIDGKGDTFNAAQATVTLSSSLIATDMVLGDCNFSFITTPTASNPSFTGVLLGSSSRKCTVYTLTLLPLSAGTGTITISAAAVKQYKTAQEILASLQNGRYTINPASDGTRTISISPTVEITNPQAGTNSSLSSYSLIIKAVNTDNTPLSQVTISLTSSPAGKPLEAITDEKGIAKFSGVTQGVYSATVKRDNKELAKTIFNVDGTNPSLTLGIKSQSQAPDLTIIILGAILVLGVVIFLFARSNIIKTLTGKNKKRQAHP